MYIQQLYTNCLSEAAYYIDSNGEAAIIDPLRDIDVYLALAKERKAKIKYIFETHFHADFVSGHLDLARVTGAPIIYGPATQAKFPVTVAADGETFRIGALSLNVMHTPGHTLESACYLLRDGYGKDYCLFTGDTLFVGDVGRPDLAQKGDKLSEDDLAGMLYDSIHSKLFPLADEVIIYPAHGPGSSCGKNLGQATQSTIGEEKKSNYAMKAASKQEFIKKVTEGIEEPPQYFPINAMINKEGYDALDAILMKGLVPLSIADFKSKCLQENVIILDTRKASEFTREFIPTAISIGLEGRFAEWAGSLLPYDAPILLVTDPGCEKESITRLARVGFNRMEGYLEGGYESWKKSGEPVDMIIDVEADELMMDLPYDDKLVVVDVRKPSEFSEGHLSKSVNIPLADMADPGNLAMLEEDQNIYVHCGGGYRSVIASSLLKRQGIHNIRNIEGGWNKIKEQGKVVVVKENILLN